MAWDFAAEIHSLSGFDADLAGTTGSISGENLSLHATQWLTDGAKEVINLLPINLQKLCTSMQTFTSVVAGSEATTLNTGKILSVFAGDQSCRKIGSINKYKVSDSGNIMYATSTDPVYYIETNKINVLPAGLSCKYEEVQYPAVSFDDTAISVFPDEAEYLVVLYAAVRAVQDRMSSEAINEDSELYALHSDKYAKLSAEYQRGLAALKGGKQ
jgi:hypothetical protein